MDYTLDANAAKQADNMFSRIEEKGKYLGIITRAEPIVSKKGSKGVDMSFKADTGATADYLTIWTHNGDGKQLQGFNTLMAIMTCLRVRDLKPESGEIEKYDNDIKARVKVNVPLFKSLMNKPIGLLLHMEEYEKKDHSTAWKPAISAPFDKDGFTASEILNKAQKAETLDKMLASLRDRPLKASASAPRASSEPVSAGPFDDMDDDIPF